MLITPDPVLPPLPEIEFRDLLASIRDHGVKVPLLVTGDGVLIDGHERHRACQELSLKHYPLRVMGNLTDAERREWAIRLNVERRHLSSRQRKELLESLLRADPARSEREVADLLRIDRSTVGRVRRGLVAGGAFAPPEFTRGRDGKRYRHPTVGVETPSQADEASRLLAELGDDAPRGSPRCGPCGPSRARNGGGNTPIA